MGLDLSPRSTGLVVARGTPGVREHPELLRHRTLRTVALGNTLRTATTELLPSGNFRGDNAECIDWTRRRVRAAFRKFLPDLVMIEDYPFAKGSRSLSFIYEQGGVIRNELLRNDAIYLVRKPSVFKQYATGSGSADKTEMIATAKAEGFKEATNSDVADAYWIARYGIENYDEMLEAVDMRDDTDDIITAVLEEPA
jgi:Holliday junction resolvasome RuvABC endonuclease subunit